MREARVVALSSPQVWTQEATGRYDGHLRKGIRRAYGEHILRRDGPRWGQHAKEQPMHTTIDMAVPPSWGGALSL